MPASDDPVPTAYLIWKDPYMTVGGDTYIHDMLRACRLPELICRKNEVSGGDNQRPGRQWLPADPSSSGTLS